MTTKAYLVSWLGKGNIIWTPLEENAAGMSIHPSSLGQLKMIMDTVGANHEVLKNLGKISSSLGTIQSTVTITAGLGVIGVGLQIAALVAAYRMFQKLERIDQKLKVIGGKFELHFLDQSIEHFLSWHQGTAGLIPDVGISLEEDCHNALDELIGSKNLKIPGYLKLKLASVADAIDAYSRFLYAVIHNGSVPQISDDRIKAWIAEGKSTQKGNLVGGFVPQKNVLQYWAQQLNEKGWKPDLSDSRLSKAFERGTIDRTFPVLLLAMQLNQALALSASVEDKVQASPDHLMLVKTA